DIGGITDGIDNDQLFVVGTANLAGTLNINLINGFIPSGPPNDEIITADQIIGSFSSITGQTAYFNIVYFDSYVNLADILNAGALTPPVATEGAAFSNVTVFHFTDVDFGSASDFEATILLGDGTIVTVTGSPSGNGQI